MEPSLFEILEIEEFKKVVIIDGDFLLFIATYPYKIEKDGVTELVPKSLIEVCRSANEIIVQTLSRLNLRKYKGFIGGYNNFRYQMYPEYKANRKDKAKPDHFLELKQHLIDKWNFHVVNGCEVDDAVISFAAVHPNSIIVSPDKDILMTVGNHYNPVKQVHISTTILQAHEYFWKSMIIGDSGDNIKGIPGKGKVYADRMWDKYTMKLGYTAPAAILELYVDNLGEEQGVIEFNKNYRCLKISNKYYFNDTTYNYEGELIKVNEYRDN